MKDFRRVPLRAIFLQIALLFTVVSVTAAQQSAAPAKEKVKIGVILALSGPIAPVGQSIQRAVLLAQEKSDPERQIEFLFEDDQFQAKMGVSAAEKLISRDKVQALITFSGAVSAAISEIAERRKIPMLAITSLSSVGRSKNYVYSIFMPPLQQVQVILRGIKEAGFKRIAIVTTEQDALLELRGLLVSLTWGSLFSNELVLPGETNLSSVVTRVMARKPDVVVNLTLPPQVALLSRQLREQGFKGQFIGGPPMFNPPEIIAANSALTGAWLPGPAGKDAAEFLAQYEKTYSEPCISEGLYGYDAASVLISAVKAGNVAQHLKSIHSFKGLAGEYPKSESNVFEVPAELKQISADATLVSR